MAHFAAPLLLVAVVLMMVVPVPPVLLDVLLAANLTFAFLILLGTLLLHDSLEFSVFPSLLLVTTLIRLALNVSSTRLILIDGYAGKVIETFGGFVIGSSVIVGLVVFLILIVIQFVVITNGAGRVAEVAARFTLDAMPGRQMAIDADLSAGLIDESQAREQRQRIAKEADFYGAMDGASKFVKGDAIAGIVITSINLFGGFAIGMSTLGLSLGEAVDTFALLSVGDGLVSQIPALLISIATGLLVTRVRSEDEMGIELGRAVFRDARALKMGAILIAGFGLLPGLPKLLFFGIAGLLLMVSRRVSAAPDAESEQEVSVVASPDDPEALMGRMRVEPLQLKLSYDVLDLIDQAKGGDLLERVRALRRQIAEELGIVMPFVRTRDDVTLPAATYTISLRGSEVGRGTAPSGKVLALPAGEGTEMEAIGGSKVVEPVFGLTAYWLAEDSRAAAAAAGATVVDRSSAVVTHLAELVRQSAPELLTRQDVQILVEGLRAEEPILADEVGTEGLPLSLLHAVLRLLLGERVPIRDLARIVEAVAGRASETRSPELMAAAARVALGRTIVYQIAPEGRLAVLTLQPSLEGSLTEALRDVDGEAHLVVDRETTTNLATRIVALLADPDPTPTAVVVGQRLRRPLARTLEGLGVDVAVLSYSELPPDLELIARGVIDFEHQPA